MRAAAALRDARLSPCCDPDAQVSSLKPRHYISTTNTALDS